MLYRLDYELCEVKLHILILQRMLLRSREWVSEKAVMA